MNAPGWTRMVRSTVSTERTQPHENAVRSLGLRSLGATSGRVDGTAGRSRRFPNVKVLTLLWLACAVVLFARRPDLLATPQLYAEDGEVFFREAVLNGLARFFP